MHDNQLKALWQQQSVTESKVSPNQVITAMQSKTGLFRRRLERRDLSELIACAGIIIIFTIFYFTVYRTVVSRVGVLMIIGGAIFIGCRIVYARFANPPAPAGATIVESLRGELNLVREQSRMLRSILWWYLGPLGVGLFLCTWGLRGGVIYKISYSIFVAVLYAFIYRINQRAREKELLPLESELKALIHSAETGEPLDEKQVANLRPIAVSLGVTENVKPVEFKVSFWQIAIYGEIGFLGIWFFLMLSWIPEHAGFRPGQPSPAIIEPVFQFQETNRFSMTARTLVDFLNKGDYASAQKLFGPEMSEVLPMEKTTNFFSGLRTRFGAVKKVEGPTGNGYRGWTGFRLECKRGELKLSLALNNEDQIAGLYIEPIIKPASKIHWVIARIGRWQRLLLLIPFFLCGLLYSC
jgi:hypothetical protein